MYHVKYVPDDDPNAEGEWTTVFMNPCYSNNYEYVNTQLPKGMHCVRISSTNPKGQTE